MTQPRPAALRAARQLFKLGDGYDRLAQRDAAMIIERQTLAIGKREVRLLDSLLGRHMRRLPKAPLWMRELAALLEERGRP